MPEQNEMDIYNRARVSSHTSEIDDYDYAIFSNVVRRREIEIIDTLLRINPEALILDLGCGAGWLSRILSSKNYAIVGIDISTELIRSANRTVPKADFVVASALFLPFRRFSIDVVLSIAALHHFDPNSALLQIKEISKPYGRLILMEPNLLNPLSALGRRLFPMDTHTVGERPFVPGQLKAYLNEANYDIKVSKYLFFFTFPLARAIKTWKLFSLNKNMIRLVMILENLAERIPLLNYLNSTMIVSASAGQTLPL